MDFSLSKIDQDRFGRVIAKVKLDSGDSVEDMLATARDARVDLLIVRLPTTELYLAQQLERSGGVLSDTLVYYQKKKIERYVVNLPVGYRSCSVEDRDVEAVGKVAAQSFKGYFGHYHADSRLERESCDAVYSSWAQDSCRRGGVADEVLLIKFNESIAAFATVKKLGQSAFEGVLFGVAPAHQGKGLYMFLMQLSQNWGLDNGCGRFLVSTQITNVVVQKNWCRVGLEPLNSFYTFHLWMNNDTI